MKIETMVSMRLGCLLIACGCLVGRAAGSSSSGSASWMLAGPFAQKNVVALVVPAEVLAIEVSLQSSDEDWEGRLRDVEAARVWLESNAAKNGMKLQTKQAVVLGQATGKWSSLTSSYGNPELGIRANLLLIADLTEKSDLVMLVRNVRLLLSKLPRSKGVAVRLGEARLGLADPEKFRSELLKKIRAHLDLTAQALGSDVELVVSGVDDPLQAQQVDERSVELALPLRVTYTRKVK